MLVEHAAGLSSLITLLFIAYLQSILAGQASTGFPRANAGLIISFADRGCFTATPLFYLATFDNLTFWEPYSPYRKLRCLIINYMHTVSCYRTQLPQIETRAPPYCCPIAASSSTPRLKDARQGGVEKIMRSGFSTPRWAHCSVSRASYQLNSENFSPREKKSAWFSPI